MKKISIVIPCYNEEENVEETCSIVKGIMEKTAGYSYEIIFPDNDSVDNTPGILRKMAAQDKNVKIIFNNRNFGFDCSLFNAICAASGDAVIFLTCDRQEPPEMIPEFISEWEKGAKVVWGQKTSSQESRLMFLCRSIYYKLIKTFSMVPQYKQVIGFGLYDKEVVKLFRNLNDPRPILRNTVPDLGYKPVLLSYEQRSRQKGSSNFRFFALFDYALNSLIHTSKVPMKIMIYLGMLSGIISFSVGCFYLLYKLLNWNTFSAGVAPIIIAISFLASLQIFFLGLIGEYILAILDRTGFTKHVIEKERINFD